MNSNLTFCLRYNRAYPLASIGHAAWILRHYGYRAVFIWGLCLYGIGALCTIAALKAKSFGGFCACIFIIGNGLGSLETAANPYITGEQKNKKKLNSTRQKKKHASCHGS